jgi:trans-2,3-dihydro-3-hydroxyanthranilate isomerase
MAMSDSPPSAAAPYPVLDYVVVDVFAQQAFAGNPLAVVFGADQLSTEQMQGIAVEFNLSETAFPVALTDDDRTQGADYRVRIFTPDFEVPFAGHPTLGTAWALREAGLIGSGSRVQACGAGMIGVTVPADPTGSVELSAVPRDHAHRLSEVEIAAVAPLVGLAASDVVGPAYVAGCGLSWLYLEVELDSVTRARPSGRRLAEVAVDLSMVQDPIDGIDVFAVSYENGAIRVDSRVFVPGSGIPEDPATGSAAAGLGLALVAAGHVSGDAETAFAVTQGVVLGRPSSLAGRVEASGGAATRVHVAGPVVPIAKGQIRIPGGR